MPSALLLRRSFFGLLLVAVPTAARGAVVIWDGSSGQTPDQITPAYTLLNTSTNAPVLSGGVLTLATPAGGNDILGYRHTGAQLNVPANLDIVARVKLDSGASSFGNRAPVGIQFATGGGGKNFLWIDRDTIFLNADGDVRGPSATVDTDGDFHTYHIEVAGTGVGSPVSVSYDDGPTPILTGSLFASGTGAEISWGDLSEAVSGTSEWTHFEHNAAEVPEPMAAALALSGVALLLNVRPPRRRARG